MTSEATIPLFLDVAFALLIVADIAGVIHAFHTRSLWPALAWSIIIVCLPLAGILLYGIALLVEKHKVQTRE
ncbi:hypothetical protein [Dietzia timorensis]|uniref:hypothetical protein n=1 Tax=Dietzia timorensis TaxID=499555 RepID=UPI000833FDEC|nr:hypothetical protein [Dietzia timorensis]